MGTVLVHRVSKAVTGTDCVCLSWETSTICKVINRCCSIRDGLAVVLFYGFSSVGLIVQQLFIVLLIYVEWLQRLNLLHVTNIIPTDEKPTKTLYHYDKSKTK